MATPPQPITVSFPLNLGMRNAAAEDVVQPLGERPALVESVNTRLTQVDGTVTKSPAYSTVATVTAVLTPGGIVTAGNGASILFTKPGNVRVSGNAAREPIYSVQLTTATRMNSYFPYEPLDNRPVPGGDTYASPATVVDQTGNRWFASVRPYSTGSAVYLSVVAPSGELLVGPTVSATLSAAATTQPWCGLTADANDNVWVWYLDSGTIKVRQAFVLPGNLYITLGSPSDVYTPASTPAGSIAVHSDRLDPDGYQFLVCRSSSSASTLAIVRFGGGGIVTTTTSVGANINYSAVRALYSSLWGGSAVLVAVSPATGGAKHYLYTGWGSSPTLAWSQTGASANGPVAVAWVNDGTVTGGVFADTHDGGSASGSGSGTTITWRDANTGNAIAGSPMVLPWKGLISNGCEDWEGSYCTPVFGFQNLYSKNSSSDPVSVDFVSDPAVEIYRAASPGTCSMVHRASVDTALIYPAVSGGATVLNSNNLDYHDSKLVLAYLEDPTLKAEAATHGYGARYLTLSTLPKQPRYALDGQGLAVLGSHYWDGSEISEWCSTSAPKIHADANTGTGTGLDAGTYLLAAIVQWKDSATGQLHRSPLSNIYQLTLSAGEKPTIRVTKPAIMKNGNMQEGVEVVIYMSQPNGTTLYAQDYAITSSTSYHWLFNNLTNPMYGPLNPGIPYLDADGWPLPPVCPPTMVDTIVIGERAWGTDGRSIWYSKPKEDGIAFEWNSAFTIQVPAAAGRIVALSEMSGMPIILCERGVWAISGVGPDAALSTGTFNPPDQISQIGCTDRNGVLKTPAGTIYRSGNRFALVSPGGSAILEDIDPSALGDLYPVLLRDSREAVWLSSEGKHLCFAYELGRWTMWDSETIGNVTGAALNPVTGKILTYVEGDLGHLDPSQPSTTARIKLRTGWIALGGPEDDNVVEDIFYRALYTGDHGLKVTIQSDYDPTKVEKTLSKTQLNPGGTAGVYYLVGTSMGSHNSTRALMLTLEEEDVAGEAMRPSAVTIQFRKNPGVRRAAVTPTCRV